MNKEKKSNVPVWLIPLFLGLACCFIFDLWGNVKGVGPERARVIVPSEPVRQAEFKPILHRGAMSHRCSECHGIFEGKPKLRKTQHTLVGEHTDLKLRHGANTHCLNCHHETDRNTLTGQGSNKISFENSELLCGKCHGEKLRDWNKGIHGRVNGYWDTSRGPQKRVGCVECHDPHDPVFKALKPLPAPPKAFGSENKGDHHE